MPKVSIIIPVYKAEKDIQRCLESVANQTFNDWECLMIDDGSPDDSANICKAYAQNDSRFLYYYKQNGGPSSARNYGLNRASGDFICFIDSDDYVDPRFLDHILTPMLTDEEIGISIVGLVIYGNEQGRFPINHLSNTLTNETVFNHLLIGDIIKGWLCNKCFRSSLIKQIRLNENLHYCEDLEFLLRLTYYSQRFYVAFVDKYDYYYYRQVGGGSLSHNIRNKVTMIDMFNESLSIYPNSESKNARLVKGCYTQCRSLAILDSLEDNDNEVIKKSKKIFRDNLIVAYKFYGLSFFLQLLLIIISFRLYRFVLRNKNT